MQIERVDRIAPDALAAEDFSFDIEHEAVAPFDGPGMPNVVPVTPRTKAYGIDPSLSEPDLDFGRLLLAAKDGLHVAGYLRQHRGGMAAQALTTLRYPAVTVAWASADASWTRPWRGRGPRTSERSDLKRNRPTCRLAASMHGTALCWAGMTATCTAS